MHNTISINITSSNVPYEALTELIEETKAEIDQLESICTFMDLALSEDDLVQVKEELTDAGYIRRRYNGKRVKITSHPYHYRLIRRLRYVCRKK